MAKERAITLVQLNSEILHFENWTFKTQKIVVFSLRDKTKLVVEDCGSFKHHETPNSAITRVV